MKHDQPPRSSASTGPFRASTSVHGVTYDGQHVWFAAGDTLNAFDPASGKTCCARSTSPRMRARPSTASTCSRSPRIASRRSIRRPAACSPRSRRRRRRRLRARVGRRDAVGRPVSRAEDPPGRSRDRRDPSHHRVQPLRHRRHLGRRRAVARHLGRRRERRAAHRSADRRGAGEARDAGGRRRVGARVRRRRSVLLRRRKQRQGEGHPRGPEAATLIVEPVL